MSVLPGKVCPLCGFDNCENVKQSFAVEQSNVGNPSVLTQSLDQNQTIEAAAKLLARVEGAVDLRSGPS